MNDTDIPALGPVAVERGAVEVSAGSKLTAGMQRLHLLLGVEDVMAGVVGAHVVNNLLHGTVDVDLVTIGSIKLPLDLLDAVAFNGIANDELASIGQRSDARGQSRSDGRSKGKVEVHFECGFNEIKKIDEDISLKVSVEYSTVVWRARYLLLYVIAKAFNHNYNVYSTLQTA